MSIKSAVQNLLGGSDDSEPDSEEATPDELPSHVCTSCGEEYYTDPGMEIASCRECGGIKVEQR
jgi:hypothetical protein